ncbi:hypothetical protein BLOT_008562 [Blomia tropicalis]|nr:hypothetical protein BLOT_008562 [Blomia tropicalis]
MIQKIKINSDFLPYFMSKGDDHICNKLSFGLFRQILLKSISYYNGENALLIFESESMYTLLKNDFSGLEQINVPQNSNDWYFLLPGFKERNGKKLKAISFVGWKANSWFFITNAYRFVNILYDHSNYMIENEKISEQDWSFNQPYQIIGKHTNDDTVGMVASYNSTFGFIFYQFTFDKTTHKLNNIPFSSSSMNMLKLIRTGNPNEVLLTDVGYQTEIDYGQLFHKMPIGYLIRNSAILFDTELHCVYIIENLMKHVKQFSVKSGDSKQNHIKLHRNNIPYEKFFKCDNDLSKVEHTLGKFRCDLEYKSNEHLNKNDESLIEEENEVKPVKTNSKLPKVNGAKAFKSFTENEKS